MSDTLLGFGLFALVAAIVGGGLKAFGFEVGALKSANRQIALATVGVALIVSAEWSHIQPVVFPVMLVTETVGPTTLEPGQAHSIPVSLTRSGRVEVLIQSLIPDRADFSGQGGMPGQDGLLVSICASASSGDCPSRQMGVSQVYSQELASGSGTISVFNFATSPRMTFTLRIKRPA